MDVRRSNVAARRKFFRAGVIALSATLAAASGASHAVPANAVPAEFQGTWVPSKATCESAVRVLVAADQLTLVSGSDRETLGGIEMAGPGFFPPDYRGIMAVLITEFSGDQPVTATFNVGEKKGTAQVEFAPVMPGTATPQLKAYNAHISFQSSPALSRGRDPPRPQLHGRKADFAVFPLTCHTGRRVRVAIGSQTLNSQISSLRCGSREPKPGTPSLGVRARARGGHRNPRRGIDRTP